MDFLALLPEIIATTLVLVYVAAIIAALEAALRTRTSQGAIAWAISLITFPYIALPLYLVFGRNKFAGYVEQRQEVEREAEKILARASDALVSSPPEKVPRLRPNSSSVKPSPRSTTSTSSRQR